MDHGCDYTSENVIRTQSSPLAMRFSDRLQRTRSREPDSRDAFEARKRLRIPAFIVLSSWRGFVSRRSRCRSSISNVGLPSPPFSLAYSRSIHLDLVFFRFYVRFARWRAFSFQSLSKIVIRPSTVLAFYRWSYLSSQFARLICEQRI